MELYFDNYIHIWFGEKGDIVKLKKVSGILSIVMVLMAFYYAPASGDINYVGGIIGGSPNEGAI